MTKHASDTFHAMHSAYHLSPLFLFAPLIRPPFILYRTPLASIFPLTLTMPINFSIYVSPRPTSSLKQQSRAHPQPRHPTKRIQSTLKKRVTSIFRKRDGGLSTPNTISTTNDRSSTLRAPHHSASAPTFRRRKVTHRRRATLDNYIPWIDQNLLPESPPSYTILAPAPHQELFSNQTSPSSSSSSSSSNTHTRPWDQLYVPPRSSSSVHGRSRTSPFVSDDDEGSRALVQFLHKEQARRLVQDRLTQEQIDRYLALDLSLQELQREQEDLTGQ